PEDLAEALCALHIYFRDLDYARTMSSPDAWETFLRVCRDTYPPHDRLSIEDATTCMRWLQRYLAVVAVDLPDSEVVHASMAGLAGIPGVIQKDRKSTRLNSSH